MCDPLMCFLKTSANLRFFGIPFPYVLSGFFDRFEALLGIIQFIGANENSGASQNVEHGWSMPSGLPQPELS